MRSTIQLKLTGALIIAAMIFVVPTAQAQYSMTTLGVPVTENFNTFTGAGFVPSPGAGQLDSDAWRATGFSDTACGFGGTCDTGDYARGLDDLGGVSTGGAYAFDVIGDVVVGLGVQPGGSDFTPGTYTMRLVNNTGADIFDFDLSYDLWVNNDQGRANAWLTSWSLNDIVYVTISSLDFTSPGASDANGFTKTDQDASVSIGTALPNGGSLYIQWSSDDVSGSGSRDEFAIRNISITPLGAAPVEIASLRATADGEEAMVVWSTASEEDLSGFVVQSMEGDTFVDGGFVAATGGGSSYQYRVEDVSTGVNTFRLKSVNTDGTFEYSDIVEVEIGLPTSYRVSDVYPNPFAGQANIEFAVQREQRVVVDVFDITGRRLERVFDETVGANGLHRVGVDGSSYPSGVYLVRVQGEQFVTTRQVTLTR